MLRFDKAIIFLRIRKCNLLVSLKVNTYGLDVILFSEFINILSIFSNDPTKLLYIFVVISFD